MSRYQAAPEFIGGPTGPGRAAPGPGGYVLAVLVADLLTTSTITIVLAAGSVSDLPIVLVAVSILVLVCSVPIALVCVPVVHLLSRRHPQQWWHMAVTGMVTLAAAVLAGFVSGEPANALAFAPVAAATVLGRAALAPAVRRARRRQEPPPLNRGTGSGLSASYGRGAR